MKFGEYLEKLIRERELSINAISNECKINRGGLYSVFKHQRRLKDNQLFALIQKLGLTETEEKELITLYFTDLYGKTDYNKITFLTNQMQTFFNVEDFSSAQNFKSNDVLNKLKSFVNSNSKVITNFSFAFTKADAIFYNALKAGKITKFIHILFLDEKDNYKYNYSSVFKSLKYMYFQQFPYYCYTSLKTLNICSVMPYFAVGDNSAILFSKDKAITIKESDSVKALACETKKIIQSSKIFGTHTSDIMQIKDEYQKGLSSNNTNTTVISISSYPCLAQFVDYETMKSVVRQELPNKDMLVELAYSHYSSMYNTIQQVNIVTERGMQIFAKTGNISEISGDLINCADVVHRIKILEKILDAIENDTFFLLDKSKITVPPGFILEKYANKAIFYITDDEKEDFASYDNFIAEFKDMSFVKSLNLVADYLVKSRKVCSKEYSLQFVNNIISGLKVLI